MYLFVITKCNGKDVVVILVCICVCMHTYCIRNKLNYRSSRVDSVHVRNNAQTCVLRTAYSMRVIRTAYSMREIRTAYSMRVRNQFNVRTRNQINVSFTKSNMSC